MTAAQHAAADELARMAEDAGLYDDDRHQPMPTACSPFCLVHKDDPDHRRWQWCRHRRRK